MLRWDPKPEWEGEDAYIIGGGPSLSRFDWGLLRGKHTIGCNSAFILGVDVVKIVVWGDFLWWKRIGEEGTANYGGRVVGCSSRIKNEPCPWLLVMDREESKNGLGLGKLGWNGNTGSLAINLALILGAKRVYLLGFDMKMAFHVGEPDRHNWHDLRYEKGSSSVYSRFAQDFAHVARDLSMFPGAGVWNVTDDSDLPHFPKVSVAGHFS